MTRQPWTEQEKAFIRDNIENMSYGEIAEHLGRTTSAIENRAFKLRLRRPVSKLSKSRLYRIWCAMKNRCLNKNNSVFTNYGGRGIAICEEWSQFKPFMDWSLLNGYESTLELERINNNGNYEPSNCRWATHQEQACNRRSSRIITAFGESKSIGEWMMDARCVVSKHSTILDRVVVLGWNGEKAITTPVKRRDNRQETRSDKQILRSIRIGMLARCTNCNSVSYARYGAKGIKICGEWLSGLEPFMTWALANGWRRGLTLDRVDNSNGYNPSNCRWVTKEAQSSNSSSTKLISAFGETKSLTDWAKDKRSSVSAARIGVRISKYGWSPEDAISTPKYGTKVATI